jgi:hypothetical protein
MSLEVSVEKLPVKRGRILFYIDTKIVWQISLMGEAFNMSRYYIWKFSDRSFNDF